MCVSKIRQTLLGLRSEYEAKGTLRARISRVECEALLAFEDSITLDWLRNRYGDYVKYKKQTGEEHEVVEAKLEVSKRLADVMKAEGIE